MHDDERLKLIRLSLFSIDAFMDKVFGGNAAGGLSAVRVEGRRPDKGGADP
jgi:hypothetical protein